MKLSNPRELARRSLGLVAGVTSYVKASQAGHLPSPLLLLVRSANQLAERISSQPSPVPSASQRRALLAMSAQLRAMTARVIISAEGRDPKSLEGELAELVRRTLELIDRVSAESPAIDTGDAIDVKVIER